ncbi:4128_t:CDS:10 [Ambispora leptoticha]|uniref:4128_t:CDS:1 n=1 Tax=Ambispora leptoticha TaxID=144679 RepID=A0A9N9A0S0_9GLOM|nr:4128_t:CDS:10 [Ambispora leptoticha]
MTSNMLLAEPVEEQTSWEESMRMGYLNNYQHLLNKNEIQINSALNDTREHTMLMHGILYVIFIENDNSQLDKHLNRLIVCGTLQIPLETLIEMSSQGRKFKLYTPRTIHRMLWLIWKFISMGVKGTDSINMELVCENMLRQIRGSDNSEINLFMCEQLVDIFSRDSSMSFLSSHQRLVALVIFTFLRKLRDHFGSEYHNLANKEAELCEKLLKTQPICHYIGRDLIRLLMDVAKHPRIRVVLNELVHNPAKFPGYEGLTALLCTPTPSFLIKSRITFFMEELLKEIFHTENQKHARKFNWFRNEFLYGSEYLVVDVIRFICACIHPTNEMLRSNLVKRWSIITELIKLVHQDCTIASQARLALFFDWLCWTKTDNIMNIEPGILVILENITVQSMITNSLIEYLHFQVNHFCNIQGYRTRRHVEDAMDTVFNLGVVVPEALNLAINSGYLDSFTKSYIIGLWGNHVSQALKDANRNQAIVHQQQQQRRPSLSIQTSNNQVPTLNKRRLSISNQPETSSTALKTPKITDTPVITVPLSITAASPLNSAQIPPFSSNQLAEIKEEPTKLEVSTKETGTRDAQRIGANNVSQSFDVLNRHVESNGHNNIKQETENILVNSQKQDKTVISNFASQSPVGPTSALNSPFPMSTGLSSSLPTSILSSAPNQASKGENRFWLYGKKLDIFDQTEDPIEAEKLLLAIFGAMERQSIEAFSSVGDRIAPNIRKFLDTSNLFDVVLKSYWESQESENAGNIMRISELIIKVGEIDLAQDIVRTRLLLSGLSRIEQNPPSFAHNLLSVYKNFVEKQMQFHKASDEDDKLQEIKRRILHDLMILQKKHVDIFLSMWLSILKELREYLVGDVDFIYLTISRISPALALSIQTNLLLNKIQLFGKCDLDELLEYDQGIFFQLLNAEIGGQFEKIVQIVENSTVLRGIDVTDFPQAMNGILNLLGSVRPSERFFPLFFNLLENQDHNSNANVNFVAIIFEQWRRIFSNEFMELLKEIIEKLSDKVTESQEKQKKGQSSNENTVAEAAGLLSVMKAWWAKEHADAETIRFIRSKRILSNLVALASKMPSQEDYPLEWWNENYSDEQSNVLSERANEPPNQTTKITKTRNLRASKSAKKASSTNEHSEDMDPHDDNDNDDQEEEKEVKSTSRRTTRAAAKKKSTSTTKRKTTSRRKVASSITTTTESEEDENNEDDEDNEDEDNYIDEEKETEIKQPQRKRTTRSQAKQEKAKTTRAKASAPVRRSKKTIEQTSSSSSSASSSEEQEANKDDSEDENEKEENEINGKSKKSTSSYNNRSKTLQTRSGKRITRPSAPICHYIGRDLIRLLMDVAKHPRIRVVLNELVHNPAKFPGYEGLTALLCTPTPSFLIKSRITFFMEELLKEIFHTENQKHARKFNWFRNEFLYGSEYLVVDVIRFICACIHPTNEMLRSNLVKRWSIITELIKLVHQDCTIASQARLALFFDWLCWTKTDNIMNIEPGILVILENITVQSMITNSLIEYLHFQVNHFCNIQGYRTRRHVEDAMDTVFNLGVVVPEALNLAINSGYLDSFTKSYIIGLWGNHVSQALKDANRNQAIVHQQQQQRRPSLSIQTSNNQVPTLNKRRLSISNQPETSSTALKTPKITDTPVITVPLSITAASPLNSAQIPPFSSNQLAEIKEEPTKLEVSTKETGTRDAQRIGANNVSQSFDVLNRHVESNGHNNIKQETENILVNSQKQDKTVISNFASQSPVGPTSALNSPFPMSTGLSSSLPTSILSSAPNQASKGENRFWLYGKKLDIFDQTEDPIEAEKLLLAIFGAMERQSIEAFSSVGDRIAPNIRKFLDTSNLFDVVLKSYWESQESENAGNIMRISELIIKVGEIDLAQDIVRTRLLLSGLSRIEQNPPSFAHNLLSVYKNFVEKQMQFHKASDEDDKLQEIKRRILHDLMILQKKHVDIFLSMWLSILKELREYLVGDVDFIYLTISRISPALALSIQTNLLLNKIQLFGKCDLDELLEYDQGIFFQLLNAEIGGQFEKIVQIVENSTVLRGIDVTDFPQAMNGILNLLGSVRPSERFFPLFFNLLENQDHNSNANVNFVAIIFEQWRRIFSNEFMELLKEIIEKLSDKVTESQEKQKKGQSSNENTVAEAAGLLSVMKAWWAKEHADAETIRFIRSKRILSNLVALASKMPSQEDYPLEWWNENYSDEQSNVLSERANEPPNQTTKITKTRNLRASKSAKKASSTNEHSEDMDPHDDNDNDDQEEEKEVKSTSRRTTRAAAKKKSTSTTKRKTTSRRKVASSITTTTESEEDENNEDDEDNEDEDNYIDEEKETEIKQPQRKRTTRSQAKQEKAKTTRAKASAPVRRSKKTIEQTSSSSSSASSSEEQEANKDDSEDENEKEENEINGKSKKSTSSYNNRSKTLQTRSARQGREPMVIKRRGSLKT